MSSDNSSMSSMSSNVSSSASNVADTAKNFLESNSLIARLAFIILVFFAYILILRFGIYILGWLFNYSNGSPRLIDGMVDAKQLMVFPQDPSLENAKTIQRSVNATDGIEFTWSVWIYIDDLVYNATKYKCVFYKGNDGMQDTGLNFPNNAPGLYIAPNTNDLVVIMNTFNVINEQITITDIPLNKWLNVIIRCENNNLDIYINGMIAKSHILHGVPKQNYGDVYVGMNGGFSGFISNLWYYNYGLGVSDIQKISQKGPNTTMVGSSGKMMKDNNFLSLRWYFYGEGDEYNPTSDLGTKSV
jgi:hypothetical protein